MSDVSSDQEVDKKHYDEVLTYSKCLDTTGLKFGQTN